MQTNSVVKSFLSAAMLSICALVLGAASASAQQCPPETPDHPYYQGVFAYCYPSQAACVEAADNENNACSNFNCVPDAEHCPGCDGGSGACAMYVTAVKYPWQ